MRANDLRLHPFLITLIALIAAIILPLGIIKSIFQSISILNSVYNAFFIIAFLVLIVVSSVYGIRLIRVFRSLYKSTKVSKFKQFLFRVIYHTCWTHVQLTLYLLALDTTLLITIATLVLFVIVNARGHKWVYVSMHWILRTEEFSVLICTYFLIRKKRKTASDSTNESPKPTTGNSGI